MTRLHLFRPLNPTAKYPASPIDLSFNGIRYDLTLPPRVGIAFAQLLSPVGQFRRLDSHCNPAAFSSFSSVSPRLGSDRSAAYAAYEFRAESNSTGVPVGYVLQRAAANAPAAKKIVLSVIQGPSLPFDVVDWLFTHAPFMDYCGGFEVAHICCYTGTEDREIALAAAAGSLDKTEPNLYQPHVTRLLIGQSGIQEE